MFLVSGAYYLFGKNRLKVMVIVLTMIVGCNSVLTYQRNKVWKDQLTLWNDTVQKSPHKVRPYINRGDFCVTQGNFTQAMFDFNKAIEINPRNAGTYSNRGGVYGLENNFTQAVFDFTKAIEIDPKCKDAYYNRAGTYYLLKEYNRAWADVHKAEELGYAVDPGFISALKKASGQDK
jgi:tetratricopeptide (TPR) repeat protein